MSEIEKLVAESSLGGRKVTANRASVSPKRAALVVERAAEVAAKKSLKSATPFRDSRT
jgi:hypothetical protein